MPGWAGHPEPLCFPFQKAGIEFLSLLWIITQTSNRKPFLLQGLCPKWFSRSFFLNSPSFVRQRKRMKPELEGHLVTELLPSILKLGTAVKAALGRLPKITSVLQRGDQQSCSRDQFNNFSSSENKSYLPPKNKNWHVRYQDWRRIMQPFPHGEQTF